MKYYFVFAIFCVFFINESWTDIIRGENGMHKVCERVIPDPGEECNRTDPYCNCRSQITCCICGKPQCTTNFDCPNGMLCTKEGECLSWRRKMIFKRSYNETAVREVYENHQTCENDSDCIDSAFCHLGDCLPNFLLKTKLFTEVKQHRVRRGGATWPLNSILAITDKEKQRKCFLTSLHFNALIKSKVKKRLEMIKVFLFFAFIYCSLATCPNGSIEWNDNCYIFESNLAEFAAAEVACKIYGGHLASIHDGFTNAMLVGIQNFTGSTITDFWIGASNLITPNKWAWTDNTSFDFIEWASNEPENISGLACAAISIAHGSWSVQDCFKLKPYVCGILKIITIPTTPPPNSQCPLAWIYYQPTHSCFGLTYTNETSQIITDWTTAEIYCSNLGAHLPSFHTFDELNVLQSYSIFAMSQLWTGVRSDDGSLTWKNSDNSATDYLPWYSQAGYPIKMSTSCVWTEYSVIVNADCTMKLPFICKKTAN